MVVCKIVLFQETRLGKLINDVRKRSTDEDLVKRLKNLVRSWQRLVGVNEVTEKGLSSFVDLIPTERIPGSAQTLTGNDSRAVFHNNMSLRDEMTQGSVPANTIKYPTNFRKSKIPVRAIKPYSSSIKHLQQFTSLRPSLSNQHSHDRHMSQSHATSASHSDTKHLIVAEEPAQFTCITSSLPLNSSIQDSYIKMQQPSDLLNILNPATLNVNLYEVSSTVTDTNLTSEHTKNQHNNPGRPAEEDRNKTRQPQASKLTYDPQTPRIIPVSSKTSTECEIQGSEHLKQNLCLVQQTHRREMSLKKIIQSSLPTSERSGMGFSVAEKFKQEKNNSHECRKRHTFIPDVPVTELPGVSREITERDLVRIRRHRWHGVNGCYDNRNNWYDWTQSITLDPYGNGSKLKILPYVAIDYRR